MESKAYSVTLILPQGARRIAVAEDEHIWDAARDNGIALPAICHQGRCLTCAGKLEQPGDFDSSDAGYYYAEDRAAGYILLCTSKPQSELRIRTHMQHEMRAFRRGAGLPAPYS